MYKKILILFLTILFVIFINGCESITDTVSNNKAIKENDTQVSIKPIVDLQDTSVDYYVDMINQVKQSKRLSPLTQQDKNGVDALAIIRGIITTISLIFIIATVVYSNEEKWVKWLAIIIAVGLLGGGYYYFSIRM